jgi:methylmalonyl-CoA/ethylmalonyl-CoA epimerase
MENSAGGQSAFSHLVHIGVVVKDMDKAVERLTALGVGPFKTRVLPPDAKEIFRGKPFFPKDRVFIKITQIGNMELELIQPLDGDSPHKEFLDTKGDGIQHLGFMVKDLSKEVKRLTENGASTMLTSEFKGGGGVAYLDLDVGGIIVELVQRPPL